MQCTVKKASVFQKKNSIAVTENKTKNASWLKQSKNK